MNSIKNLLFNATMFSATMQQKSSAVVVLKLASIQSFPMRDYQTLDR